MKLWSKLIFVSAFFVSNLSGYSQQQVIPRYSIYPLIDAEQNNVQTRTIIPARSCGEINSKLAADTINEQYDSNGLLVLSEYNRVSSGYGPSHRTSHYFDYSSNQKIVRDSTVVDGTAYVTHYAYDKNKILMRHPSRGGDSSEVIFSTLRNGNVISQTGIDRYGDTVYLYSREGNIESEELWKRDRGVLRLNEKKVTVKNNAKHHITIWSYCVGCDQSTFKLEEQFFDNTGHLNKHQVYIDNRIQESTEYYYNSSGKLTEKKEITHEQDSVRTYREKYIYDASDRLVEVQKFSNNEGSPFYFIRYAYNERGLLAEIREVSATDRNNSDAGLCTMFLYTYYNSK